MASSSLQESLKSASAFLIFSFVEINFLSLLSSSLSSGLVVECTLMMDTFALGLWSFSHFKDTSTFDKEQRGKIKNQMSNVKCQMWMNPIYSKATLTKNPVPCMAPRQRWGRMEKAKRNASHLYSALPWPIFYARIADVIHCLYHHENCSIKLKAQKKGTFGSDNLLYQELDWPTKLFRSDFMMKIGADEAVQDASSKNENLSHNCRLFSNWFWFSKILHKLQACRCLLRRTRGSMSLCYFTPAPCAVECIRKIWKCLSIFQTNLKSLFFFSAIFWAILRQF